MRVSYLLKTSVCWDPQRGCSCTAKLSPVRGRAQPFVPASLWPLAETCPAGWEVLPPGLGNFCLARVVLRCGEQRPGGGRAACKEDPGGALRGSLGSAIPDAPFSFGVCHIETSQRLQDGGINVVSILQIRQIMLERLNGFLTIIQ